MLHVPDCTICFSPLKTDLCVEKNCGNVFHGKCLEKWIDIHKTCPLCIKPIKNFIRLRYEIDEKNEVINEKDYINSSKEELYNCLQKNEDKMKIMKNEIEKHKSDNIILKNKNEILQSTVETENKRIKETQEEIKKLKNLNTNYFYENLRMKDDIEEYIKELNKYKDIKSFLHNLSLEDLNSLNVELGLLSNEEKDKIVLNYIKKCRDKELEYKRTIDDLNTKLTIQIKEIEGLKAEKFNLEINYDSDTKKKDDIINNVTDTNNIINIIKPIKRITTNNILKKKRIENSIFKSKTSGELNRSFIDILDEKMFGSNSPHKMNSIKKHSIKKIYDLRKNKTEFINNYFKKNINGYNDLDLTDEYNFQESVKSTSPIFTISEESNSKKSIFNEKTNKKEKKINLHSKQRKSKKCESYKITDYFKKV